MTSTRGARFTPAVLTDVRRERGTLGTWGTWSGELSGAYSFPRVAQIPYTHCIRCNLLLLLFFVTGVPDEKKRRKKKKPEFANQQIEGSCELVPLGCLTMGMVSFAKVILPAFAGSCVVSYAFWDLARNRKVFGGTVPPTLQDSEWEKETHKKLDAWPREAAGPVVMNPISRQNYHKT